MTLFVCAIWGGGAAYAFREYRKQGDSWLKAAWWSGCWPVCIGVAIAARVIS